MAFTRGTNQQGPRKSCKGDIKDGDHWAIDFDYNNIPDELFLYTDLYCRLLVSKTNGRTLFWALVDRKATAPQEADAVAGYWHRMHQTSAGIFENEYEIFREITDPSTAAT